MERDAGEVAKVLDFKGFEEFRLAEADTYPADFGPGWIPLAIIPNLSNTICQTCAPSGSPSST